MYGRDNPFPYSTCIDQINKLASKTELTTPYAKLQSMATISDLIKKEIREFWRGVAVDPNKLALDADQIIMIYIYIASKAKVRSIFA